VIFAKGARSMVRMGRWNGVLVVALVLVTIGWPVVLGAHDDPTQGQIKALKGVVVVSPDLCQMPVEHRGMISNCEERRPRNMSCVRMP